MKFEDWTIEVKLGGVSNEKKTGIPYDGYLTFNKTQKEKEVVLIEVKSGNANKDQIIKLIKTVEDQKAGMGIFVCFEEFVTKGMHVKAKEQGKYIMNQAPTECDKIQILTVEDLLEDKEAAIPYSTMGVFKTAQKQKKNIDQGKLF